MYCCFIVSDYRGGGGGELHNQGAHIHSEVSWYIYGAINNQGQRGQSELCVTGKMLKTRNLTFHELSYLEGPRGEPW